MTRRRRFLTHGLCLACLLLLAGCPGRAPIRDGTPPLQTGMVKDLRIFPQDLSVYARISGEDASLLTPAEQAVQDARFNRIFFGPWDLTKPSVTPRDFKKRFGKPSGYYGSAAWTQAQWDTMVHNADTKAFPARGIRAITLRQTNLREMPTMEARYSKPTPDPAANPFDNFQYSLLPPGMPVYISHVSRDKQWYFIENPIAAGWVRAVDLAPVDAAFISQYRNGRYAALIRDNVPLTSERGEPMGTASIGAIFPVAAVMGDNLLVMAPVPGPGGMAAITRVLLKDGQAVIKPLPVMPKLLAVIGNEMMGQPYGWGGTDGNRDCSAATRDLFTPFGIWLPRNSAAQARMGSFVPLEGLPPEAKETTILNDGVPFMTLLWMRGHVGLYVGKYKGRAAFFHNIWGVRVEGGTNGSNRHVIGRCVVTSLEPGKELDNANPDGMIIHRIRGMSTLPGGS